MKYQRIYLLNNKKKVFLQETKSNPLILLLRFLQFDQVKHFSSKLYLLLQGQSQTIKQKRNRPTSLIYGKHFKF